MKNLQYLSIRKIWTGLEFCTFSASDFDLARMTLGEGYHISLGHKQYLCEVRTSNVSPKERYGPDTNFLTERQTDRLMDKVIPIYMYSQTSFAGGIQKTKWSHIIRKIC